MFLAKNRFGGREEEEGRESEGESGLREKNGEESRVQEEWVRDGTGGVKEGIEEESEKEEGYYERDEEKRVRREERAKPQGNFWAVLGENTESGV